MINKKRLIQTFIDLVKIDSPSGEEEKVAQYLVKKLKELGATVERDTYGNVIGKFEGIGKPMMLNSHMDTVEPGRGIKPIVKGDTITSDGTTVLGGDAKAGVAIILEALASLKDNGSKHVPLEIVFTRNEEMTLLGAKNLDYSLLSAKRGLTFDGEGEAHRIDISSAYYKEIHVTVTGRDAHAGVEPEKGISAIKIASEIISLLNVGRIDEETTANIGLISGGSASNAIPRYAYFQGEIRSRNKKKRDNHLAHFQDVFSKVMKKYPEAKIEVKVEKETDGYSFSKYHPMLQHVWTTFQKLNMILEYNHSGGLTDVNIFNAHGIATLVVGTGDYEPHTLREYVKISEMYKAARFCEKMVSL